MLPHCGGIKTIWLIIGSDINKETKLNGTYSATQCEQKWKNITKVYRDTVDHNMKSGNERKECPYFHELQDFYGYRPNVTPLYVSSSIKSPQTQSSSVETEDEKDVEKQTSKKPKVKHNRKDAVVEMLQAMRDDMKQEQKQLMEVLTKQHEDRMANEKGKLELFAYLAYRGFSQGPLFISSTMHLITLSHFRTVFKKLLAISNLSDRHYKLHSFRIGACTQEIMTGTQMSCKWDVGVPMHSNVLSGFRKYKWQHLREFITTYINNSN
ncbi:uncharacterized protein LOC132734530 [Ruditapes philippinarum]|uniref:uncharacterized protein LOC132734530 n=1 Tax=Ruditapes philippinarum TaxID=129788 RepID=UPI00295C0023|nr:uncharacterized protein LOC132734530 [Ruditapes philippinarum]